ncbi:MAG: hypothetical protein WC236_10845 [Gallionellaceae bacterium]|jgi:hypothetical protein
MDLINKTGGKFHVSGDWWWFFTNLAYEHGWAPKGTRRPPNLNDSVAWSGDYDTSDGQIVEAEDAGCIAAALQSALDDPNARKVIDALLDEWFSDAKKLLENPHITEKQKAAVRATARRPIFDADFTRALIGFCKQGEFQLV